MKILSQFFFSKKADHCMRRNEMFGFRVSNEERQLIAALANCLQRSQSDAVRFVVINAARELEKDQSSNLQKKDQGKTTLAGI
jgi:hypothetical protein